MGSNVHRISLLDDCVGTAEHARTLMIRTFFVSTLSIGSFLIASGCSSTPKARSAWDNALLSCVENDVQRRAHFVYLGPTNVVGPGSVWTLGGGGPLEFRWDPKTAFTGDEYDSLIRKGAVIACESMQDISRNYGGGMMLSGKVAQLSQGSPFDAKVNALLSSAKNVTVTADGIRVDVIEPIQFNKTTRSMVTDQHRVEYSRETAEAGARIMTAGVWVEAMTVTVTLGRDAAAKPENRFEVGATVKIGERGAEFTAVEARDGNLSLKSKSGFYVAGVLRPFKRTEKIGDAEFGLAEFKGLLGSTVVGVVPGDIVDVDSRAVLEDAVLSSEIGSVVFGRAVGVMGQWRR